MNTFRACIWTPEQRFCQLMVRRHETITDHEYLGLTINKTTARKKYNPDNLLTDTGYADDLSLLSNTFKDTQE